MPIKDREGLMTEIIRINRKLQMLGYYNENMDDAELILIQKDLLNLIKEAIEFYDATSRLELWEKANLVQALHFLSLNLNLKKTTRWLWVSLAEVEQSTAEKFERNDDGINKEIDKITKQELLTLIIGYNQRLDLQM